MFLLDINDYERKDSLGSGGMGHVYKYAQKRTGEIVAVKWVLFANTDQQKAALKEVTILSSFSHPAIMPILGFMLNGEQEAGIVMPCMARSLNDVVQKRVNSEVVQGWTNTKKMIVLLGTAAGLMTIHGSGGAHRDMKPENILLDDNFHPCVTDFGISTLNVQNTQGGYGGTLGFMAPELSQGDEPPTEKVDIYAFGIIAYMVICERKPFKSRREMLESAEGRRPVIPDNISDAAKNMITQCWDQDPSQRPSARALVNFLMKQKLMDDVDENEFRAYKLRVVGETLPPKGQTKMTEFELRNKAMSGDVDLQVELARKYLTGDGLAQDVNEAKKFFKMAADFRPEAGLELGKLYLESEPEEAVKYFGKASKLGSTEANAFLVEMIEKMMFRKDERQSLEVVAEVAARRGPGDAFRLAEKMFDPNDSECPANVQARKLFEVALKGGMKDARYYVALMCERGIGGPVDGERAIRLYMEGDKEGCLMSTTGLGDVFMNGKIVKKDIKKASEYYLKAQQQGYEPARRKMKQIEALAAVARLNK